MLHLPKVYSLLVFNNGLILQYGKGSGSGTFPISFTVNTYALSYSWVGSSDIDWVDRISKRTITGFSIAESKGTKLYIVCGY